MHPLPSPIMASRTQRLSRRAVPCLEAHQVETVQDICRARLKELGVAAAAKTGRGGGPAAAIKKRSSSAAAPHTPSAALRTPGKSRSRQQRIFGRPVRDLSKVLVRAEDVENDDCDDDDDDDQIFVPKVLTFLCEWMRREERLRVEGVFRKSGNAARQRIMRECFEASERWDLALAEASPLDVAGIIKQWVRELPEPLVPQTVQKVMLE